MVRPYYGVELMYLRQDTKAPLNYYNNGVKFPNFDLGIDYIMLADNRYFSKPGGKVDEFGSAMLGVDVTSEKTQPTIIIPQKHSFPGDSGVVPIYGQLKR